MRKRSVVAAMLAFLVLLPARQLSAAEESDAGKGPAAFKVEALPVNQWKQLPISNEPGHHYAQPVYVPTRGQLLWWGGIEGWRKAPNDVRAFDMAQGEWVSDYAPTPEVRAFVHSECHRYTGAGVYYGGTGRMLKDGRGTHTEYVAGGDR